ncbi:MAG: hypothetical protein ACNA8R_14900, partial [Nitriliruptoraceae bacterium]
MVSEEPTWSRRDVLRRGGVAGAVAMGGAVLGRDLLTGRDAAAAAGHEHGATAGAYAAAQPPVADPA